MDNLSNLHVVRNFKRLPELLEGRTVHATNEIYSSDAKLVVPTTLAGFQYIANDPNLSRKSDAFVIGVNSDKSLTDVMTRKGASQREISAIESDMVRARKVAEPLALQHSGRQVFVVFFDEETPNALYDHLAEKGVELRSLHKHGYGTTPDAPKIEGSENFAVTLAFPLPNDKKPVCFDITPVENQTGVAVVKLTEANGPNHPPYLSNEGNILFKVDSYEIYPYTQECVDVERQLTAAPAAPKKQETIPGYALRHE